MCPREMPGPRRLATLAGRPWFESVQAVALTASTVWALVDRGSGVPGPRGRSLVAGCLLVLLVLGWCLWAAALRRPALRPVAVTVLAGCGGALAVLGVGGPGVAVGALAVVIAADGMRRESSLAILAVAVLANVVTTVVTGPPGTRWLGNVVTFGGCWLIGYVRSAYRVRAEQAEHALAQERRAIAAEKHAAALEERARIAREIHDILAHSLSALSVNLSAAEGFLAAGSVGAHELAKARECVSRAGGLARDGMAETRRAVLALREDPRPLLDQLTELVQTHPDRDAIALEAPGVPMPVSPAVALVAFRTVQEALTNARKHAPGAPVTIGLGYGADVLEVTVRNPMPEARTTRPLAASGSGSGLAGLAERAMLAGGVLSTGEDHGTWRVRLRIPA
jgi:signal transduction histidine kinase